MENELQLPERDDGRGGDGTEGQTERKQLTIPSARYLLVAGCSGLLCFFHLPRPPFSAGIPSVTAMKTARFRSTTVHVRLNADSFAGFPILQITRALSKSTPETFVNSQVSGV
ncbi:hypothetical protein L1887_07624 [Cichorium endivia]|nr:hypothetical protein L1887_07624 [Cichorium endivia]